jgi:hypothetical protein
MRDARLIQILGFYSLGFYSVEDWRCLRPASLAGALLQILDS